jgi:hypothetical protein
MEGNIKKRNDLEIWTDSSGSGEGPYEHDNGLTSCTEGREFINEQNNSY